MVASISGHMEDKMANRMASRVEFKYVPTVEISLAGFNPDSRTDPEAMRDLQADIKEVGILSPLLLVDAGGKQRYQIADGHRRYRAANELGLEEVPAVIVHGLSVAEAYRRQFITKRPSGKEVLSIYLKVPGALPKHICKELDKELAIYGREQLVQWEKDKVASPNAFRIVHKIDKWLKAKLPDNMTYVRSDPKNLLMIAKWLFSTGGQAKAVFAVEHSNTDARFLWRAIQNGVKLALSVAE
jgi:hypothetical protein